MGQAGNGNGTKSWLLGALFAVFLATAGGVYTNVTDRLDKVEAQQAHAVETAQVVAVQIAVLQTTMTDVKDAVDRIESSQKVSDDKLTALLSSMNKNTARWSALMRDYEDTLDRLRLNPKR